MGGTGVGKGAPSAVVAIRGRIKEFLDSLGDNGKKIGGATFGIYVFYDYDGEPIYVGQTYEGLRSRIGRHLTNQRTDAVAMNVLDPFEVCDIEVWPFWDLASYELREAKVMLAAAEFTVFESVIKKSTFQAVLNEKQPPKMQRIKLPVSYRGRIIPDELFEDRVHADVRIARRASTIASLARVISERQVQPGLRNTLLVQAQRLEELSRRRFADFGSVLPTKGVGEQDPED